MKEDILLQISNRLREFRKDRNVTLQDLAERSGITKSMLSQIENSRTVPSLLVLMNLIKSLEVDLNGFFKDINLNPQDETVIVKKAGEYQPFEKENIPGYSYRRILSAPVNDLHIDMVMLTVEPGASRPPNITQAFEYKFMVSGKVRYTIADKEYDLEAGDSIFFDGRELHCPLNITDTPASMLVIYFFSESRG